MKKLINAFSRSEWSWAFFDWANSAYATTVMAGFFPIMFKSYYAKQLTPQDSTFWLGLAVSVASLLVALLNPLLGFVTDRLQNKKKATFMASVVTWLALVGLFGAGPESWAWALSLFGLSLMGFNLGMSFYDSLLKYATPEGREHMTSALGYSLGYLGGGLLLLINIGMVTYHESFGWSSSLEASRYSFLTVVIWWMFFSVPFYLFVKEKKITEHRDIQYRDTLNPTIVSTLWWDFVRSLKKLVAHRNALLFLAAYWLYIDVVYTVINMATDYGTALGLSQNDLIKALLLVQFLGFPATLVFGRLTQRFSTRALLIFLLGIYFVTLVWAYYLETTFDFWALAFLVSLAQGGVQSLSRSLFAQLISVEQSGEWFGIFNLVGRFASILGPLVMGLLTQLSGSHRIGILGLAVPLLVGMVLLFLVKLGDQVRG